ncbi:hypothetical protein ACFL1N_04980 [Thermodesulfobacteriota bacterium]
MTPDELRNIIAYLRERVDVDSEKTEGGVVIIFNAPSLNDMTGAGLNLEGSKMILEAGWWDEMVTDIIETPDFCEWEDPPEQVLEYAKDVISDYLRKRVTLNGE